jgi:hypothetical protein
VVETVEELNLQLHTIPTALHPKIILGNLRGAAQAVHTQRNGQDFLVQDVSCASTGRKLEDIGAVSNRVDFLNTLIY